MNYQIVVISKAKSVLRSIKKYLGLWGKFYLFYENIYTFIDYPKKMKDRRPSHEQKPIVIVTHPQFLITPAKCSSQEKVFTLNSTSSDDKIGQNFLNPIKVSKK
jgi:hypothetical protein